MQKSSILRFATVIWIVSVLNLLIAQQENIPSDTVFVSGKIRKTFVITADSFDAFPKISKYNLNITNQKGEIKKHFDSIKGVSLKLLLNHLVFDTIKPKELNEFYFVFEATDGYKAVFSWNEIFNTEVGKDVLIITEINGIATKNSKDRIMLISTADLISGRRFIKNLKYIKVNRI